jgi:hypothetical protein
LDIVVTPRLDLVEKAIFEALPRRRGIKKHQPNRQILPLASNDFTPWPGRLPMQSVRPPHGWGCSLAFS